MTRPKCECHGLPMVKRNDWMDHPYRCSVDKRNANQKYRRTTKGLRTEWTRSRRRYRAKKD